MKNNKTLILMGVVLIFILGISSFFFLYNPTLCIGENACIIDGGGLKKIKKLKFDEEAHFNLISIENNKVSKIENLDNQISLVNLGLTGNEITKIEGLDKLTNLNTLDLSNNEITKIEGLSNLTNLKYIYLQGNPIDKIENIEQVNTEGDFIWYLPYEATSITQESYDYLKANPNVQVYFVKEGENVHTAVSDKGIDDLEIV